MVNDISIERKCANKQLDCLNLFLLSFILSHLLFSVVSTFTSLKPKVLSIWGFKGSGKIGNYLN